MMDLATIQAESASAARKAAREGKYPWILWPEDVAAFQAGRNSGFHFPFIGDWRPRGWKLVETYFVDASGFGSEGEPALTIRQFAGKVKAGMGYAVIEAGQFQVYVGEFRPPKRLA